jgi:hypothetical protein
MVTKGLRCAVSGLACRIGIPVTRVRDGMDGVLEALARRFATWHAAPMQSSKRPPRAGGAAIALLAIGGVVIGNHFGQASIGLLAGFGSGVAIALALWLLDRRG